MALVWIVLVVVLALMVWDDIPRWWAATLHHGTALWQGLTTHGAIAAGIGALVGGGAGAVVCGFIGWATGRALARGELQRTQQALTQAQRDAADDRQSRRHFEQQATTARQEQACAQRRAQGLQGQFDKAVRLADSRGRQLRDLRRQNRELKAQLSDLESGAIVTPIEHAERHGSSPKRGPRTGP